MTYIVKSIMPKKNSQNSALATGQAAQPSAKMTPMMRQYVSVKADYPDCILFFRLGDFYEMFFEDAQVASEILDIALTSRSKGKDSYPMCGVPYFSASGYIAKLVDSGHKVAVCDQVEDAKQAKGIVKREVTRVVSPGMITDPDDLDARKSNFIGSLALFANEQGGDVFGLAFLDVSTADFRLTEMAEPVALLDELRRIGPREVILPSELEDSLLSARLEKIEGLFVRYWDPGPDDECIPDELEDELFGTVSALGQAAGDFAAGTLAARRLLGYAIGSLPGSLEHVRRLVPYAISEFMLIDDYSRANLELFVTLMDRRRKGSLLDLMDGCRTPMGARMLYDWLNNPLVAVERITARHDAVEQLTKDSVLGVDLAECLARIRDLERLSAKISVGQASPRDLGKLRDSLGALPGWAGLVSAKADESLARLVGEIDLVEDLFARLDAALIDEPPVDADAGGAIRAGYDTELDELIDLAKSGRAFIAELEKSEREATGISSLKIRYNKVFGYYIEVTKPNLHLVPGHYRRKQTTANAERYETDELKEKEEAILGAQENSLGLEKKIIASLADEVRSRAARIQRVATQVATTDVIASMATLAVDKGFCRPLVDESELIEIVAGRHPVVEQQPGDERFVPNDVKVDCKGEQVLVITGPNMAGKSTTIRQVALITVMAQMGSFVPASSARIGVVDRIFTRIGAADNLARGLSTFMVEMTETSHILHNATRRSLLILDEIGRGTSTFDGLSIAWAVAEYIHDRIGARTLFATHYHQLTDLAMTKERIANYTISVKEWKDQIIFLRTLVKGVCNRSYGIQVARLAGLPPEVTRRAVQVLSNLDREEYDEVGTPRLSIDGEREGPPTGQLRLFSAPPNRSRLAEELDELDLDGITPLEALQILHRLKEGK